MNMNWIRKTLGKDRTEKVYLEDTLASIHATTDIIIATPEDVEGNAERIKWINGQTARFYNHKALEKGQGVIEAVIILTLIVAVIVGFILLAGYAGLKISEGVTNVASSIPTHLDDQVFDNNWLANLPLTKHAIDGHPERNTDAMVIRNKMANGGCGPVDVWICPDQVIITCNADQSKEKLQLGLFVASSMDWIISGLPARSSYWDNKKSGCSGPHHMIFP